jgi:hypothetical protein
MRFFLVTLVVGVLAGCGRTSMENCAAGGCANHESPRSGGDRAGAVVSGGDGTGGAIGSGGSAGHGGVTVSGGNPGGGVAASAGMMGSSGGVSGGCPIGVGGNTVACSFYEGRAEGVLSGSGWVALGRNDSVTSPTCGGQPVTSDLMCPAFTWATTLGLCVSGTIPALPWSPTQTDYDANWGIMVGTDVSEFPGCTLRGSYKTVRFEATGSPQSNLRAVIHLFGDADKTVYCASLTSNTKLPFTAFNTSCWDDGGTQLTLDDVPDIDKVGIQIPSGQDEIQVSSFCLHAIFVE